MLVGAAGLLTGADGALLVGAGAELLLAAVDAGAGAELDDDAPAGALEAGAALCLELEQPANTSAATTTGSQTCR